MRAILDNSLRAQPSPTYAIVMASCIDSWTSKGPTEKTVLILNRRKCLIYMVGTPGLEPGTR